MHLVYLDESGNSGQNLNDQQQPVFVLCAMVVDESQWQSLETSLRGILDARMPGWKDIEDFEIHAAELRSGSGSFSDMSVPDRIALRDDWMKAGIKHGIKLIYRSIFKKSYATWLTAEFGPGICIHPYVMAFAMASRCIDNYLGTVPGSGILIVDENKEIVLDIEKSIRVLRGITGTLRLSRIIEKGFFIESHKSLPLQLCDLFALSIRKYVESRVKNLGKEIKPFDASGVELAKSVFHDDKQHDGNVVDWVKSERMKEEDRKKEAARGVTPESTDVGP